jgi:hypothetical protein
MSKTSIIEVYKNLNQLFAHQTLTPFTLSYLEANPKFFLPQMIKINPNMPQIINIIPNMPQIVKIIPNVPQIIKIIPNMPEINLKKKLAKTCGTKTILKTLPVPSSPLFCPNCLLKLFRVRSFGLFKR